MATAEGRAARAARLGGAAAALREALGIPLPLGQHADRDRTVQAIRTALSDEAFEAAWAEGATLTLEEAVAVALDEETTALPLEP